MRRDVLVYISGPLTANGERTLEGNIARAVGVYFYLIARGIPAFCPHMGGAFPSAYGIPYGAWIDYDLAIIDHCTHLLMLDGWGRSKGAQLEHEYAIKQKLPIFTSVETLTTALGV